MEPNPAVEQAQSEATGAAAQTARMRAAVDRAIAAGPGFLRGDIDAEHMAHAMVHAVRRYVEQEQASGRPGLPQNAEAEALRGVLAELHTCGSGFLAGRCDAACVARTMTHMVHQFGPC